MRRFIECTTGHNNLNYLQSKICPEDVSELCRFCEEEPETFDHLLNECPCFHQAQVRGQWWLFKIFGNILLKGSK